MPDTPNSLLYARGYGNTTAPDAAVAPPKKQCNCAPACECGLLECLCRPRFFAGQLLTEQDLNRLDAYIRGKNRLHTLQLHGYGVVNGLEVRCEPCGTGVVVGTGYAISPCGDDIVVCCDTLVDVCALVSKCQPPDATCQPYQNAAAKGCEDVAQDWVLSIRYAESQARGVAALRMGPTCGCGSSSSSCSCGKSSSTCGCGSKSGGCSCGSKRGACGCGKPTQACSCGATPKPRDPSPECEPTVVCEGYSFDVCLAPKEKGKEPSQETQLGGALPQNYLCCLQALVDSVPATPGTPGPASYSANPQAWFLWCCQTKQALIDYFASGPESDCTIPAQLAQLTCPDPNSQTFVNDMVAAVTAFSTFFLEAILACFCHALLPPAPCGTTEDRIPLAVVSVRRKDCKVLSVCNFTPLRKTVLSFPALEYWFGWLPIWKTLADIIHDLCCRPPVVVPPPADQPPGVAAVHEEAFMHANPAPSPQSVKKSQIFASMFQSALARGTQPLDPRDVVGGIFDLDLGGKHALSDPESANPSQFLLLNQVMRPIAASVLGGASFDALHTKAGATAETDALKKRVSALEKAVKDLGGDR